MSAKKHTTKKDHAHPLLHHPIKLDQLMHMVTGVTSLYMFALVFAVIGFVGGYYVGQDEAVAYYTQNGNTTVAPVSKSFEEDPLLNLEEEDIDIFLQELLNEDVQGIQVTPETQPVQASEPIEMPVAEEPAPFVQPEPEVIENDDTSVVPYMMNENEVMSSLTQEDSLAMNEASLSAPNFTSSNDVFGEGSLSFYSMIISLGGTVYALNLLHEDEDDE